MLINTNISHNPKLLLLLIVYSKVNCNRDLLANISVICNANSYRQEKY